MHQGIKSECEGSGKSDNRFSSSHLALFSCDIFLFLVLSVDAQADAYMIHENLIYNESFKMQIRKKNYW